MGTDSDSEHTRSSPPGPSRGRIPRSDIGTAAVLLVFGAVVYALTAWFEEVPPALSQGMPPTYFPRLLVWTVAALTVAMLIEARSRPAKKRAPIVPIVLITAGMLVLAVAAVRLFGLLVMLYVVSVAFPLLWGERRLRLVLGFAALFPTGVYLLFAKLLEVQFPRGILLRWLGM